MKIIIHFQMILQYFQQKLLQNSLMRKHLLWMMVKKMVKPFTPQLIYVEPRALEYPNGKRLVSKFEDMGVEIRQTTSHNQIRNLPGDNHFQKYRDRKSTRLNSSHVAIS